MIDAPRKLDFNILMDEKIQILNSIWYTTSLSLNVSNTYDSIFVQFVIWYSVYGVQNFIIFSSISTNLKILVQTPLYKMWIFEDAFLVHS